MLSIPGEILTLLKSKVMVGDNRPAATVTVSGMPLSSDIGPFVEELNGVMIKHACALNAGNGHISNFVADSNGKEFCVVGNPNTGKIERGLMANNEDYLAMDYPIITTAGIGADLNDYPTQVGGWFALLYRRDDGKVLMIVFVPWIQNVQSSRIECYISNSGNGDDFVLLSYVRHPETWGQDLFYFADLPSLRSLLVTADGTLLLNVWDNLWPGCFGWVTEELRIYRSVDGGLTWELPSTSKVDFWLNWQVYGMGQLAQLPDGTIFYQYYLCTGGSASVYSQDDGVTWQGIGAWFFGTLINGVYCNGTVVYGMRQFEYWEPAFCEITENVTWDQAQTDVNWLPTPNMPGTGLNGPSFSMYRNAFNRLIIQWPGGMAGYAPSPKVIVPIKSVVVDRSKGSASQATVVLDNKLGIYAPDPAGKWHQIIWTNKEAEITLGYGTEQPLVFTGIIDDVDMTTYPAEITFVARDFAKKALDQMVQMVWAGKVVYSILYQWQTPEYMFRDLALRAGFEDAKIHTEETGLTIAETTFSQEQYADAFQRLAELAGFEWFCDETGEIYYRKAVEPDPVAVYEFTEGVDIFSLGYKISDAELYRTIVVVSQDADGNTVSAAVEWSAADYYGVPQGKTMIIQAADLASTAEQCAVLAQQAADAINPKPREVSFVVVGNPYLQIGDCLRVIETTTTISEIYRIFEMTHNMSADGTPVFSTAIKCYHYAEG